jgi:hypothetical protein
MANADLQVLKDLSVAAGQLYDGAVDSKGEPVDLGLKRDSLPSTNRKYIDAGKVRFAGDKIIVSYEAEITLKQVHKDGISGFQSEMDSMIQKLVDGLKKNYRAHAGKSITLTAEGDGAKVDVEYVSRYRTLVHAVRSYRVAGLSDVVAATGAEVNKREMADSYKKFLEMGGFSRDSNA